MLPMTLRSVEMMSSVGTCSSPPYPITEYDPPAAVIAKPSFSAPCSATKSSTTSAPAPPVRSLTASTCDPSATTVWLAPSSAASFSASGLRSTTTILVAVSAARHWMPM